ncbi:hypothetical protein K1719_023909 [Acacia pycnantha]|nr:hypothetical protein K1719_023909 [Acacia pycnantha]
MMEEKLLGCRIKACPHITSRIKTLKRLRQTAYDMVYWTNTLGFGWDPGTKCVIAEKEVWDDYIKKYKSKEVYDEYEETTKWKRDNEAKEAKKRKRVAKKNADASVSKKRKGPLEVDGDSLSESSVKDEVAKLGGLFGQVLDEKLGMMHDQM